MTSMLVRSAITAGCPNCHVPCGGACQTVWPCEAIARISSRGNARLGDGGDRSVGEPAPEGEVEPRVLGRARALQRCGETRALARCVGPITCASSSGVTAPVRVLAKSHHGSGDAIERGAGHQSDEDIPSGWRCGRCPGVFGCGHALTRSTGGGASASTRRITPPPAAMRSAAASGERESFVHHDGQLHAAIRRGKQAPRLVALHAADRDHQAFRAVAQLVVGGPHIDHQVAVRLADADHRTGRDAVEHQLGGGARLEPRGARDDLRARDGKNRHIGRSDDLGRWRRAGEDHGARAQPAGELQSAART
jgi:hypothetical protein